MSARLNCFLLFVIVLITSAAFAQPTIVNFDFGAVPIVCSNGYAYQGTTGCTSPPAPHQDYNSTPGFGWTLGINDGLTGPGTSFQPPPFDGLPFTQAVFLQGPAVADFVTQEVGGFSVGSYTLSFYLGSRYNSCCGYDGNQTVQALIDGNVIGTWALTSFTPFTLQTVSFSVSTGGTHTLEFKGINDGDHTAFLSYVNITQTGGPVLVNFDFGAVRVACSNGYTYEGPLGLCPFDNPTQNFNASPGFGWILGWILARSDDPDLHGGAGLTGPGTRFDPPSFNGLPFNQAVFLENGGSFVWQTVGGFTAGSYILSLYLGSRYDSGAYDGNQTVVALIDGNVIGTWALSSYTPFTPETAPFTVSTDGSHTLMFRGVNHGDHTAFLSYVVITSD